MEEYVHMEDAGIDFNLPYPPISGDRPERTADIIIFVDASGDCSGKNTEGNQWIANGLALKQAEQYARDYGHPFPTIPEQSELTQAIGKQSMLIFKNVDQPNVPTVIYMPLTKIRSELVGKSVGDAMEVIGQTFDLNTYGTMRFNYGLKESSNLIDLMRLNTITNADRIRAAIRDWCQAGPGQEQQVSQAPVAAGTSQEPTSYEPSEEFNFEPVNYSYDDLEELANSILVALENLKDTDDRIKLRNRCEEIIRAKVSGPACKT